MYQVFDSFLAACTWWHTPHPQDEARFFQALDQIVRNPTFSPDTMGAYMRNKFEISAAYDAEDDRTKAIVRYTAAAWAVREYLEATGQL